MPAEKYSVFVDISAKIEAWEKKSVVVVANGHVYALRLAPAVKVAMRNALVGGRDLPQYALFAAAIYITLRPHLALVKRIRVDLDYSGVLAERALRRLLLAMIRRDVPAFKGADIRIEEVAGSRADELARQCYHGKRRIDGEITLSQLEDVLGVKAKQ